MVSSILGKNIIHVLCCHPPLTSKGIKDFDATLVDDGVSVRVQSPGSTGKMIRGDQIADSSLKLAVTVHTDDAKRFAGQALQDVYKYNSGTMRMDIAQKRKPSSDSLKREDLRLVDEALQIRIPKHFDADLLLTYIRNTAPLEATSRTMDMDEVIFLGRILGGDNINYALTVQFDNYIPLAEIGDKLRNMHFTRLKFGYADKGMAQAISRLPKLQFPKLMGKLSAINTATKNGKEIYSLLESFLLDPQSFSFDFIAAHEDSESAESLNRTTMWKRNHQITVGVNGKKAKIEMGED